MRAGFYPRLFSAGGDGRWELEPDRKMQKAVAERWSRGSTRATRHYQLGLVALFPRRTGAGTTEVCREGPCGRLASVIPGLRQLGINQPNGGSCSEAGAAPADWSWNWVSRGIAVGGDASGRGRKASAVKTEFQEVPGTGAMCMQFNTLIKTGGGAVLASSQPPYSACVAQLQEIARHNWVFHEAT